MQNRLWIILGLAFGLTSVILVHNYMAQREQQLRRQLMQGREPTPVLVAQRDIAEGATLDAELVGVVTKPADAVEPRALSAVEQALGKISAVPITKGEQILESKLAQLQSVRTLSMKVPSGKRAVTINVDAVTGVGGFIRPGDYVDVIGLFNLPSPDGKQATVTVTLLQRVLVLAVGGQFSETQKAESEGASATTVTLALSPKETELVLFGRAQGTVQLSLRSKADAAVVAQAQPMTLDALVALILGPKLLEQAKQQAAQQAATSATQPKKRHIEVYRGLQKEVVTLADSVEER